jgi:hypothetical protein
MFKPELSKSKKSIWQTRKTYSETRSEYDNIKIKKHLDKHIDVALDYLGQAKSELKKNIDLYDHSSSKKRLKTHSSSSHSRGIFLSSLGTKAQKPISSPPKTLASISSKPTPPLRNYEITPHNLESTFNDHNSNFTVSHSSAATPKLPPKKARKPPVSKKVAVFRGLDEG